MKRIAVLTSGGDCAGMNACIRSVVRCGIFKGLEVFGVFRGYGGLINGGIKQLKLNSVSNIIGRGGTFLKTARSAEFMNEQGQKKAVDTLKKNKIDGLITVGGEGTFKGAHILNTKWHVPTIGIPATIDNDINGTDYSIGSDTAVNIALEAIDKIRDTATSLERIFVVEVMGRKEGYIAIRVGLSGGAEDVLIPATEYDTDKMCRDITIGRKRGKVSWIIIVAEGIAKGSDIAELIEQETGYETRATTLGHVQRGGSPTAFDRILAARLGMGAVEALIDKETDKMAAMVNDQVKIVPLDSPIYQLKKQRALDRELYKLIKVLAA
ncbi:MAG: 6-phosphofructokinase [Candidatus Omnitrophota bacterium]|nr:6-phosphofructokinase [Candidatus Omnitrophota bacterium]